MLRGRFLLTAELLEIFLEQTTTEVTRLQAAGEATIKLLDNFERTNTADKLFFLKRTTLGNSRRAAQLLFICRLQQLQPNGLELSCVKRLAR